MTCSLPLALVAGFAGAQPAPSSVEVGADPAFVTDTADAGPGGPTPVTPEADGDPSTTQDPDAGPPGSEKKKRKVAVDRLPIVDADPPLESLPAKRAKPDYDGRGKEPTTAGDVLLWIPRLLVGPLYLAHEYLIRRPIGAVIMAVERDKLTQRAIYVFTLGGQKNVGFFPTFFYDFNLLPSAGVYVWWDDALARKNHVRFHFGTWGPDWISTTLTDRYDLSEHSTVSLRAAFSRRSDNLFYGLGPESEQRLESRYEAISLDVGPRYDLEVVRGVQLLTAVGVRDTSFGEGTCCESPKLHERIRAGQLAAPPRLDDGYTFVYQSAGLSLDSRRPRPSQQSGVRLSVSGQPAFDVSRRPGSSWVKYEGTVGGFWDVTGSARVLSLSVATIFVDPLQGPASTIPFTELTTLGGFGLMRGFLPGRLVDRSAAVATLGYQWPIWAFFDGTMQVSAGNVFGAGLRGFDAGKLRLSTGLGIRSNNSPDHQFEVLAGFGTDTFERGTEITSFRLAFGATRGF
ncbi:MAG TPA: hypothetical protein VM925_34090 [Labilithrix sp.]|nr:hypothetical protein [Labilithrix sp.]